MTALISPALAASVSPKQLEAASCLPWMIGCQVGTWFSGLVLGAIKPLLSFAGHTELTTKDYTADPAVASIWSGMLGTSDALFLLLLCAGGVILMGYHTYQGSYTVQEVAPRFTIAMAVANSSLLLASKAIGLSNGISTALSGGALPATTADTLTQMLQRGAQGNVMLILLVLATLIVVVIIAIAYIVRQMAVVLLIAIAPLALAGYALPHTSWAARWWWRALAAALAIPPAQALVLNATMHVFFGPGWTGLDSSNPYLVNLLTALCMLYIVARIPFWISRPVLSPFGRSPVRSALRFAWGAAVLSRFGRTLRGSGRSPRPSTRQQPRAGATENDPPRSSETRRPIPARPAALRPRLEPGRPSRQRQRPRDDDNAHDSKTAPPARPPAGSRPGSPHHSAPPPLPAGDRPYSARHAATPPLPAGDGATGPASGDSRRPSASPPLPAGPGATGATGTQGHAVPPLPAAAGPSGGTRPRPIPPLPSGSGPARPLPALPAGDGTHGPVPPPPGGTTGRGPVPPLPGNVGQRGPVPPLPTSGLGYSVPPLPKPVERPAPTAGPRPTNATGPRPTPRGTGTDQPEAPIRPRRPAPRPASRPTPDSPPGPVPPLPAHGTGASGKHAAPPPLPADRDEHRGQLGPPPPLPAPQIAPHPPHRDAPLPADGLPSAQSTERPGETQ